MAKGKKKRKIILLPRAVISAEEISFYYFNEFSLERMEKVLASINEAIEFSAKHPFASPAYFDDGLTEQNVRKSTVHNTFKIIYEIYEDRIEVIEIFHSSNNPNSLEERIAKRKNKEQ